MIQLKDICDIYDCPHTTAKDEGKGYPLVRTPNVGKGRLILDGIHRVSEDVYNSRNARAIPEEGDLILAREAPVGNVSIIMDGQRVCLGQRVVLIKPKRELVDPHFLTYYLLSAEVQHRLKNHANGAVVAHLNVSDIRNLWVTLPELEEQVAIGKILRSIDDKIELNRQINDNLEQQAEALYKSWFVDFEPFKDGKFIESELGQIPEGWRIYTLNELMDIKRGSSPRPIQSYLSETGLKWLKISDATSCSSPFIYEIQEHIKPEGLRNTVYLQKGALVLSNSATPGLPKILGIDTCIHDGWLYFPISKLSNPFMYLMFIKFRENLISQANGSVFMNLKTEIVKNLKIALPKREIIEQFDLIISSVFNEIRNRTEEMLNLSKQRDTLLPKLMSGEIKINEIDC